MRLCFNRPLLNSFILSAFMTSLISLPAVAAPNDIDLSGLIEGDSASGFAPRNDDFRLLSEELAVLFTPSPLMPAETTGLSGFDFGLDYSITDISSDQSYWSDAVEGKRQGRALNSTLQSLGFRGRKGFILPVPLTSEVEFGALWLVDSRMVSVGTNLRLALNEGFQYFPDIAVMGGAHTVVGSDDFTLFSATAGASISKSFAIGGTFNFTPFVNYQSLFYNFAGEIIDPSPIDTSDVERNIVFDEISIQDLANRFDRVSLGARMNVALVQLTVGVDVNILPSGRVLPQFATRAGLYF